jgi:hypothetical protein
MTPDPVDEAGVRQEHLLFVVGYRNFLKGLKSVETSRGRIAGLGLAQFGGACPLNSRTGTSTYNNCRLQYTQSSILRNTETAPTHHQSVSYLNNAFPRCDPSMPGRPAVGFRENRLKLLRFLALSLFE